MNEVEVPVYIAVPLSLSVYEVAPGEVFQEMLMEPVPQESGVAVRDEGVGGAEFEHDIGADV